MSRQHQQPQFSSEGFDLDALADTNDSTGNGGGDVIYEIGGGATATVPPPSPAETSTSSPTELADEYKSKGNEAFKERNWLEAVDMYTAAIEALPGQTAAELLEQQAAYEKEQQAVVRQRLAEQDEKRRRSRTERNDNSNTPKEQKDDDDEEQPPPLPPFTAPPHVHAERLAVLHANRAAALMGVQEYDSALVDCNAAILWKPDYVKAILRRAALHEKLEDTEKALQDAKLAQQLDPSSRQIRATVTRLQKLEDERLEKLKAETLDKLKDLGNSILGNFGLSLDNFKAVQDPNTGSYSISFNQNNGGGSSGNTS